MLCLAASIVGYHPEMPECLDDHVFLMLPWLRLVIAGRRWPSLVFILGESAPLPRTGYVQVGDGLVIFSGNPRLDLRIGSLMA